MKNLNKTIHIFFYISCLLVILPAWADLFGISDFESQAWFFDFNVTMLCLVNMVNWLPVNKNVFKISVAMLFVTLGSTIFGLLYPEGTTLSIVITLKSISFFVMIFYFFRMLYIRTKYNKPNLKKTTT